MSIVALTPASSSRALAAPESGGGEKGGASVVTTVEAPRIYAAMSLVNTYISRGLTLMHAKGIIFSEAMARDGFMNTFIPALLQFREMRETMFVAVSREKPEEILELMKPVLDINPAKYIELLATTHGFTSFIPRTSLDQFYKEEKVAGVDPVCMLIAKSPEKLPAYMEHGSVRSAGSFFAGNYPKKGGIPLEAMGSVAFRGSKMAGVKPGPPLPQS